MMNKALTRRRFASHLSGLGAALTLSSSHAKVVPIGFGGFSEVKLAVATICADGFGNQRHEPSMAFLRGFGYENVELNLWYPEHLTPSYVRGLKARCEEANLIPVSIQSTSFGSVGGKNGLMKDLSHKLLMMQVGGDNGFGLGAMGADSGV